MRSLLGRPRARAAASGRDAGASLLLVLLIVTVIALVSGAILSLETTSLKTTTAVRDQAAGAYAADGAAQVVIAKLEQALLPGGVCTSGVALGSSGSPFYTSPAPSTAASLNAFVSCAAEAGSGTGGPTSANASPGNAILTLGNSAAAGENGIEISSNAGAVKVRGGVFSNSTIDINSGGLQNTFDSPPAVPYTIARGDCINQALITPAAYRSCNYSAVDARGADPGTLTPHGATYDQPPAPTGNGTVTTCGAGATYQRLTPGRYTDANVLTNLTGCSKRLVHLMPGIYYLNFTNPGSHVWSVDDTYVVGGSLTIPVTATPTPAQMPNACVKPMDVIPPDAQAATTTSGVRLVFGGDSQMEVVHTGSPGGQVTICASKSSNGPPVAISGVKTSVAGTYAVSAQSGCVTALPPATRCPMIYTDQSPNTTLTIQGTTYVPRAGIYLSLNNSTNQVFRWGLIVRALLVDATGSADLASALIDVPDAAASPISVPDVMYLNVYVCPATETCDASDTLRLRAKVKLLSSVTTPYTATVLSWSVQR